MTFILVLATVIVLLECMSREVVQYYKATRGLYERWGGGTKAIHFGYFPKRQEFLYNAQPEDLQTQHRDSLLVLSSKIVEFADVKRGESVLDAGCGYGTLSNEVKIRGASYTGINIANEQLQKARRLYGSDPKITFLRLDYADTKLPSATFDKVIFIESLCHARDKIAVIRESARLLKPKGRLVIADYFLSTSADLSAPQATCLRELESGWSVEIVRQAKMSEILSSGGLTRTRFEDLTPNIDLSVQIAANSCRAHEEGEKPEPSEAVLKHRKATIGFAELLKQGIVGYRVVIAGKS